MVLIETIRYITEISPAARRGTLVSLPQFMATIGVCTGYFTCYGSIHIDSSIAWRVPFIIMGILAVILAGSCVYLPKSPRWLQINGRRGEALRAVERLGISSAEAEKDIFTPSTDNVPPRPAMTLSDFSLVFNKEYRMRTSLGIFILGMVQLCGIDGVLYVGPLNHGSSILYTNKITSTVRPHPVQSGGLTIWHCIFPRIRAIGNPHASNFHSCIPLRRQLGP